MNGTQHYSLGLAVGYMGALTYTDVPIQQAEIILACCAGSLYPDLDNPNSILGHILWPVSKIINRISGHRGFFHSLVNVLISSTLLYFLLSSFGILIPFPITCAFFAGFLLHLLQDSFTRMGVPCLWPLKWRLRLSPFASDNTLACWSITILIFFLLLTGNYYFIIYGNI